MTKELWINLPVKDLARSKEFFTNMGFKINPREHNNEMIGMSIGEKNIMVMLVVEPRFKHFTQNEISDTARGTEVMFSIDAESREEVDQMAQKAVEAGGKVFGPPAGIEGWMYGCGFSDLDGHRWNVLYMDMSKMPKQ